MGTIRCQILGNENKGDCRRQVLDLLFSGKVSSFSPLASGSRLCPSAHLSNSSASALGAVQFSSVAQSCPTPCDPIDCSTPGLPVHHQLPELLKLMSIELVIASNHLILYCPLLLPPSIFPSITVFSNESALPIKWPKYWSFSFSISP